MNHLKRFYMKKITIYRFLAFLVTLTVVLGSCTKEMSEVRLEPTLSTSQTFGVKSDSATVVGFVVAQGDGFTERGVCYNVAPAPTVNNSKVAYTKDTPTATFNVVLSGLKYATKYYARAYATTDGLTVYGEEVTFTTLPVKPTVTTVAITEITGKSASTGGNVTVTGGATVTARGVCFGLSPNPTVAGTKTTNGDGPGEFVSLLTGLKGNTKYYLRSYATNSAGTGYGPEVSFTTLVDLPAISTSTVTEITKTTAVSGGNVTYDGGNAVTERGIVWGMTAEPTINNNKIITGAGTGVFASNLTNLEKFTTYHVRAYAINSAGIAYGANSQFTTMGDNLVWNIPGDYVEKSYPGSGMANWSPDKSPQVKSTVTSPDNIEGYVYMANTNNSWKFATQPNWNGPNYGDGGGGSLSASAGDISSPKGYYKINANAANMKFTAVATIWGVIGSATPNEWKDETPLAYDPASKTWRGVMHLTANQIKFRANHDWGLNYGSDNADGKLRFDAPNIPITVEADYAIILDLSLPNEYTYIANRWGLIGDAQGSWDKDTDMTWDATKNVFTVTLDLVSSGSFKFRANDAWALNYGGNIDNLTFDGPNISVSSNGNYTITFDPWKLKATVTKN
jgi:hypothetical protein